MKLLTIVICFLTLLPALNAQKYKYGKVSKEELEGTSNPEFPNADATVLYREYKTYFEYQQSTGFTRFIDVFERIKIHNTHGFDWATRSIETKNNSDVKENLVFLNGTTYTLENGSIEKEKLKNSAIFEKQAHNYLTLHSFTMPNLKPGCVIEFEYRISSPFYDIGNIDLQYTIPIQKEVVQIAIPEYFIFQNHSNPQAALGFSFQKDTKEKEVNFRAKSGLGTVNYDNKYAATQPTSGGTVKYMDNLYFLEENNIPPLKKEVYVDNLSNYQARTLWELALTNFPNEVPKTFSTTWENVTKSIYESDDFANQIKQNGYYEDAVANATAGLEDPLEKMTAILALVKSKVKWNKYFGYFPEKGVRKAFKEGEGNRADINLMLISMLQSVNLKANPVLVSTKSHGIPVFPTREGFNYVIAAVEYNGEIYLLDATLPFSSINLLPEHAMNWQGRLIRPDGSSIPVGLYPGYVSQTLTYVQAEIKDGTIEAKVNERKGGHFAKNFRTKYYGTPVDDQIKSLKTTGQDVVISDYKTKDLDNTKSNVSLSYTATATSLVENINGDLYFSPMLFFAQKESPFKEDKRTYPVFFEFPRSNKYTINIKLPEGYKVASMPEGTKASLLNDLGSYTYLLQESAGNMLQLSVTLDINSPIILSDDYEFVKAMFAQVVDKEKEKVVLTKI